MGEDGGGGEGHQREGLDRNSGKEKYFKSPQKDLPDHNFVWASERWSVHLIFQKADAHEIPCLSTYQYTIKCNIKVNHKNMQ